MKYLLNLFTPDTWASFRSHGAEVSGFRPRQRRMARERVEVGDVFLCYLVRLSRWCGALDVISDAFEDDAPIYGDPDPFTIRFRVRPIVMLDPDRAIPIFEPEVWSGLSDTRSFPQGASSWTGAFRSSLRAMPDVDGMFLLRLLRMQAAEQREYPYSLRDRRQLARKFTVRAVDREVAVEVPEPEEEEPTEPTDQNEARHSIRMQAKLAEIGAAMGFRIWVPRGDRQRVLEQVSDKWRKAFLDQLPLNYDDNTLRTIANIDVIWLRGRSMSRAFEVEHTTAIYSGLLRMADLLALQPNMNIRLHIVAPDDKRERVLREIRRPVFSLLERGPLYESCTFLPYSAADALGATPHLPHMSDSIIEEYEESAEHEA